ncbi:MAG: hypothetical protein U1E51_22810 [Candidatus Binatia bacterium]|nr:hypothetical protein [Candidatus Binatia bacterium]
MRRAALLGLADTTEADMPLLGEIPRTEADIRAAIGGLENPVHRLSDRLFWFHRPPGSRDAKAPARPSQPDGAVWDHDESLRGLFAAFEAGFDDAGVPLWIRALRAWHQVVSDDDYWAGALELEQRGAFEPAAFPSEIYALRDNAVGLAAEPLVVAARDAVARDDRSTVRRILTGLEELADTGPWVAIALHDIASPAVERFRALCRAVREEFGSKIVREQDAGERNKRTCDAELKRFRAEIEPELRRVIQLVPTDHPAAQESREEAALCLSGIATDYTWADDFITSEKLREEALKLAQDTLGAIRIEEGLAQIREAARKQRVFGALKPISSAPSLWTFYGIGFTLLGRSDDDPETRSYVTMHYFVALFVIPIFPVGRYRVIDMGANGYNFLGKLPFRKVDRWHLGVALTAIAAIILIGAFSNQNSNVSSAPTTRTYAPSSERSQMSALKARIESGRSRMADLKTQLQPVIEEFTRLNAQMETLKAELKSLDEQQKAGIQIDVDDYNAKVKTHNELLAGHRALIAANSADIQTHDDLAEQDSVLVKQYNSLLKGGTR